MVCGRTHICTFIGTLPLSCQVTPYTLAGVSTSILTMEQYSSIVIRFVSYKCASIQQSTCMKCVPYCYNRFGSLFDICVTGIEMFTFGYFNDDYFMKGCCEICLSKYILQLNMSTNGIRRKTRILCIGATMRSSAHRPITRWKPISVAAGADSKNSTGVAETH